MLKKNNKKKIAYGEQCRTVFVGVSGGVDSSVSAVILKDQGYDVVGVFIRTWTPEFIDCTWRDERRDAMRVCAHLGIPFLECDAEKEYKKSVADYMIEEYKKGRTPNPDVMCNREVKFGVFWNFAKSHGADYIATGHYAVNNYKLLITNDKLNSSTSTLSLEKNGKFSPCQGGVLRPRSERGGDSLLRPSTGSGHLPLAGEEKFFLTKSPDQSKDQSYFLWTLTQDDLAHTLFPIGHLEKSEVRRLAKKYKIPVAEKKDSQGVCFLGPLDMKDFLKHYIKPKEGLVLSEVEGKKEVIGYHNGAVFFTLGERHGFTITKKSEKEKPYYVVAKDIKKNTITVSTSPTGGKPIGKTCRVFHPLLIEEGVGGGDLKKSLPRKINIFNTNWIASPPDKNKVYQAQIRYHGELLPCRVTCTSPTGAKVELDKNVLVDSGQSIVIYNKDICLGGGIVE